jgi:hypothetical protein
LVVRASPFALQDGSRKTKRGARRFSVLWCAPHPLRFKMDRAKRSAARDGFLFGGARLALCASRWIAQNEAQREGFPVCFCSARPTLYAPNITRARP